MQLGNRNQIRYNTARAALGKDRTKTSQNREDK